MKSNHSAGNNNHSAGNNNHSVRKNNHTVRKNNRIARKNNHIPGKNEEKFADTMNTCKKPGEVKAYVEREWLPQSWR